RIDTAVEPEGGDSRDGGQNPGPEGSLRGAHSQGRDRRLGGQMTTALVVSRYFPNDYRTVGVHARLGTKVQARAKVVCRVGWLLTMCVLMALARKAPEKTRRAPLFFDLDDIEHVSWFRRLLHDPGWPAERLQLLQVPRLMLAEIQAIRLAAVTFVCSEADRRYLARFPGTEHVQTVPNSVTFPPLDDRDISEPLVLFVGSMGYRPNIQA